MTSEMDQGGTEPSLTPKKKNLQLATAEELDITGSEVNETELQAFLETLARIAHAVASRRSQEPNEQDNGREE